ncbi:MAG: four helix bundle protein [Proteobacteria bacterium]|nr:four helix bundle protein [Pseudomonadota bacterium]
MRRDEIKTHKDLDVWKEGIELVVEVYNLVKGFPKVEIYGIVDQIKRAVISIPSNIAEGASKNSKKEFLRHLFISLGSLSELETQLIIAKKLGFFDSEEIFKSIDKERYKIIGLIKYLQRRNNEKKTK